MMTLVVTVGSGGTASGIATRNYLTGSKLKQGSSLNFFSIKMVYNFYVLLDWTLGRSLPVYNFVKKWKLRKIFSFSLTL